MPGKSLLIVFISTLLNLTSINAQVVDPGAVPPDFKRQEHILIIIKPENKKTIPGFEKFVDKHFKKHYTGKYEFATEKEVESESRFQDKKIYKFSLRHKIRAEFAVRYDADGKSKTVLEQHARYNFFDRESGTEYGSFAEGRNEAETVERIAKILEGTYKYLSVFPDVMSARGLPSSFVYIVVASEQDAGGRKCQVTTEGGLELTKEQL